MPEHDGQRPCSVGLESVARISTRYPRGNSYPFRNTTALWHKNGPEPYQGPRLTSPAETTLQGRDPHHTIPGCQRGNHGLHTRGHGCPRADHIIAASPPMLPQHISREHKEGRQISTCNNTISLAPHPPFVKIPVGGGGHRFQKGHISASPTIPTRLHHNGTLEGLERTQMRVRGSHTHTRV